ncbi:hypothetical protein Bresa_03209|uniref:Uncharacterized protein n=1 Tax=Brenneria salicis ATCC 15712 = DSM 30166 TaxID=714314 RepID=A0A366HXW8_9GAMM|nr:hypothetical protein [Brenneria salicis ATCC 15712 = DSM 30166]RBP58304.1 hypothetical protein DES54_15215 [Brenneria salicis ATCC 15712 = DSM 30166]
MNQIAPERGDVWKMSKNYVEKLYHHRKKISGWKSVPVTVTNDANRQPFNRKALLTQIDNNR